MNPSSGVKPPTVSSSTSHAWRSVSSTAWAQRDRASSAAALPAIRLTSLPPPCGRMWPSGPRWMVPSVSAEKVRRPAATAAASGSCDPCSMTGGQRTHIEELKVH